MEKINIAKLLRDCPQGMELDCTICNGVKFIELDRNPNFPIVVRANNGYEFALTKYGQVHNIDDAKCVIFPKGETTWKGFVPPCKFKDGDVLAAYECLVLFKELDGLNIKCYCTYHFMNNPSFYVDTLQIKDAFHPATEEEKQKLFQAIKDNGYRWNSETKTLEKLIEPLFKVGDKIRHKKNTTIIKTIGRIYSDGYALYDGHLLYFKEQDEWELVPNKFDINTLKPFESKVLVRCFNSDTWQPALYGFKDSNRYCIVGGLYWKQCIPYEGNKHLLGKTYDCDEFYKTW